MLYYYFVRARGGNKMRHGDTRGDVNKQDVGSISIRVAVLPTLELPSSPWRKTTTPLPPVPPTAESPPPMPSVVDGGDGGTTLPPTTHSCASLRRGAAVDE